MGEGRKERIEIASRHGGDSFGLQGLASPGRFSSLYETTGSEHPAEDFFEFRGAVFLIGCNRNGCLWGCFFRILRCH